MPVRRLMLTMGIPMILSLVLQAVYNIVDSIFVSNMAENGEEGLNALTLDFPIQMLIIAFAIGTGVGVNALTSKSLGQDDREKASRVAGNGGFMAVIIFIAFVLFGLFGAEAYVATQTSNPVIAEMAVDYLRICCVISEGAVFFAIYEKLLQANGHSMYSTAAQITGALTNIVLDPIMIYGWFGCPEMGVRGAAYATVIGQIVSFLLVLLFHIRIDKSISNKLCYWKPSGKILKEIYAIGFPAIVAQALLSVMSYGLNLVLVSISEAMVTAYGLYYKLQQFALFASFAMRDAITPIISFNHGMKSKKRIKEGIQYGMMFTLIVMLVCLILIELFANPISRLFGLSGETNKLCISAIRIISISFVFAGANISFQGIFQALDGGLESLVISVCRQLVFIFPFAILFAHIARQTPAYTWTVWTTFPIAEVITVLIACVLFRRIYRREVLVLEDE